MLNWWTHRNVGQECCKWKYFPNNVTNKTKKVRTVACKERVMLWNMLFWKSHFFLSMKTELDKWFSSQTLFLRPVESALKENWTFDQISQHQNHFGHVIKIKKFEGSCTFMVTILLRVLSLIAFSLVWFDEVTSDEISSMVSWSICTYGNL